MIKNELKKIVSYLDIRTNRQPYPPVSLVIFGIVLFAFVMFIFAKM